MTFLYTTASFGLDMSIQTTDISPLQKNIQLNINLQPDEKILKQTLRISLDHPSITNNVMVIDPTPSTTYLPEFHESKEVIQEQTLITLRINLNTDKPIHCNLYVHYLQLPENSMIEKVFSLDFNPEMKQTLLAPSQNTPTTSPMNNSLSSTKKSFTESIQDFVQTTDSTWIRLLFAYLLGLLLSLTPCIYPMIPITIGILSSQARQSLLSNFIIACCYAIGMSMMFASLGLLAAFAGASFGSLLSQPIFVIFLVLFIGYMSLTMIGIIDLKIPAFLQRSISVNNAFGPHLSAFIFGLISGSVASPCVSPGLALLLTLVATMANVFAGFLLLFCFGIGLSTPLIIIATFSSSMQLLPQAGMWMVEVKKGLGFVMLATCLYYLHNILPANIFMIIAIGYVIFAALFYIMDAQKDFDARTKTIKSFLGIALLATAVFLGLKLYDQTHKVDQNQKQTAMPWIYDYAQAKTQAIQENKLLMLDFWANHCTICKAIEKKIFDKPVVYQKLQDRFLFVKIDCTHADDQNSMLKNKFQIFAQPAILIINPTTETILKRWSSEPYSMTPEEFIKATEIT